LAAVGVLFEHFIFPVATKNYSQRHPVPGTKNYFRTTKSRVEHLLADVRQHTRKEEFSPLNEWLTKIQACEKKGKFIYFSEALIPCLFEHGVLPVVDEQIQYRRQKLEAAGGKEAEVSIPSALGMAPGEAVPGRPSGHQRHTGDAANLVFGSGK